MCVFRVGKLVDSSLDLQAIQLPALQYQHERRSHDWTMDDTSSTSGFTDVTDFTDSGTLISEDCSNIKLNTGVRGDESKACHILGMSFIALTFPYLSCQVRLHLQQFYAMFLKRALYSWRNWKVMVAQFLVPLIFTIVALVVARTLPSHQDLPLLRLALSRYGPTKVPLALQPKPGHLATDLADAYTSQLSAQLAQQVKVSGKLSQRNSLVLTA